MRLRPLKKLTGIFLCILAFTSSLTDTSRLCTADVVKLETGGSIEGIVTSEESDEVEIQLKSGTMKLKKDAVAEIEKSSAEENEALKTRWALEREREEEEFQRRMSAWEKKAETSEADKELLKDVEEANPSVSQTVEETESQSELLEYKLAVINKGGYVSQTDITVARFRYLLRVLEKKTVNSKQQIADMTVTARKHLRSEYGKDIKLLDLMESVNEVIPYDSRLDYAEAISAYIVLLK